LFTRRLADLALAGLPLDRALQVVAEQSENESLTMVAENALNDVKGGMQVSDALGKYPKLFPEIFTSTLKAGEQSGQFGDVAEKLAEVLEKEVARKSQVISALIYPAILSLTSVGVVIFLLTFVVPRMSGVFKDLGKDLPLTTSILLATTDFLTQQWMIVIGGIIGTIVMYRIWVATPSGAEMRDALLMRLPIAGPIVQKSTISRFARVLGTLVYGGVPILDALQLAGTAAGNLVFKKNALKVQEEVREGRAIADSMRDTGAFPPVLTHMVAIGEETGDIPRMLGRVSNSLDFEVDTALRRAISIAEPTILVVMGGFVGFVVLSIVLPIFQAQELVK
jgi:type II secretory pathway component PulF